MTKLLIDGIEVDVPPEYTVLQACEAAGAEVPLRFVPRAALAPALECPHCGSPRTERLSAFGSTACKALYRCLACREPFEHFKPL